MRVSTWLRVATLVLASGTARAAGESGAVPAAAVQAKVDRETLGQSHEELLRREEARRAETEERVEKIRNLPAERIQDWISGKMSEAELDRVASEPHAPEPAAPLAMPRARLNRLVLLGVTAMALACLYGLQRRRGRMDEPAEKEEPWAGSRRTVTGPVRYNVGSGKGSPLSGGRQRALPGQQRFGGAAKGAPPRGRPEAPRPNPVARAAPASPALAVQARGGKKRGGKAREGRFDLAQNWGDGVPGKRGGTVEARKKNSKPDQALLRKEASGTLRGGPPVPRRGVSPVPPEAGARA